MKLEKLESHFCVISTLERALVNVLLATNFLNYLNSARYSIPGTFRVRATSGIVTMMTHVLTLSVILSVCCVLAEKSEYVTTSTTTEQSKGLSNTEDRFLVNVIRDKNSSELVLDSVDGEETKKTDKKPRTVLHRDSSLERDKSIHFRDLIVVSSI